jgi:glutathione synthase/RimK-type ligase-like ATP-grasp enzyme
MWIKIEIIPQNDEVIYIPKQMRRKFDTEVKVSFGKRSCIAFVEVEKDLEITNETTYENPQKIMMSSQLASKLLIYGTLTYQMKGNYMNIIIGPTIGMLLGNHNYSYGPLHMEKYSDRLGVHDKIGGLVYAFSTDAVDWQNNLVYGLYYNTESSKWEYGKFPIPSVIYRRDFHSVKNIQRLIEATNGKMFNSARFTKFNFYQYVKQDRELIGHLPPTELSRNYEQIKNFLDRYEKIILKPTSLSRGRGICIISKDGNVYRISDYRGKEVIELEYNDEASLKDFFDMNGSLFTRYLVQKHLSLANIDDGLFDIRVVMQKEKPNAWQCSGIECRVAAQKSLLTNISRGGYALTIDEALKRAFPSRTDEHEKMKEDLDALCLKLCKHLDRMGHHFAEFGMDIALDKDGNMWIIEVNVFPSFKGFKTMDPDIYLKIRYTPMLYAAHLAGF